MPAASLVDTHCHLNFRAYDQDRQQVLQRAREAGVERIIIPAIDEASCQEALELANADEGIFAAVGIHPNSIEADYASLMPRLRDWSAHPKVVAIGEIGLDYHWDKQPRPIQRKAFEDQLALAADLRLPVIIHNRQAGDDVISILESWAGRLPASIGRRPGVLHSFSASARHAERALALGFYLGFTGPVTFKKADELRAIAKSTPGDHLLIETDAPFLTPHPHRGKRNESAWLPYINQRLAQLHGISFDDMARATTANAERLFALPAPGVERPAKA